MKPELFTIPFLNYPVKSYGFMLMIGFFSAIYIAAKRAEKVRANPDMVINLGFFALIGGVVGARMMFVIHYWETNFAGGKNPIFSVLDITRGGMEFLGGVIGAFVLMVVYLWVKRESIRLYFDILSPSLMWGLAFGRVGCLLNGCCWGGLAGDTIASNWAITFPYGSSVYRRQFENNQLAVPAPLQIVTPAGQSMLIGHDVVKYLDPRHDGLIRKYREAKDSYEYLSAVTPDSVEAKKEKLRMESLEQSAKQEAMRYATVVNHLQKFPSADFPGQGMTPLELAELAQTSRSLPVHPAQPYGTINALLLSLLLVMVFRHRKRDGMVFAMLLITYPITRILLELIRVDNPKDTFGGLTVSQGISLVMIGLGIVLIFILRQLPEKCPLAKPWEPPPEEKPKQTS